MDVSFALILVEMVPLVQRPAYDYALQISLAFGIVSGGLIVAVDVQKFS